MNGQTAIVAAQGSPPDSVGDFVGLILFGLAVLIPGVILATNYRKLADRHLAMTYRFMDSGGMVAPWRRKSPVDPSNPPEWIRYQQRLIGTIFALGGSAMVVRGIVGLSELL